MRNVIGNQAQRHCYDAGREARDLGKDKSPPGGLGAQRRSWWLAGYNDRDIELQAVAMKPNIPACDYRIDMEQN